MSTTTETATSTTTTTRYQANSFFAGARTLNPSPSTPRSIWPVSPTKGNTDSQNSAGPSAGSSTSTLRSLYPRAARSLLQRDFELTHTLIESAFVFLTQPVSLGQDAVDIHRRKWDLLRITLETTAFTSPPTSPISGPLPSPLRANLTMTSQNLVAEMHARSVRLFTPQGMNPSAAFLPAQILVALIFSSLKLHCPDKGRSIIEDWLAQRRHSLEEQMHDTEGYVRVVELFCLQVLPRLHDWEYAEEFLEYERELLPATRQNFITSLKALRRREIEAARTIPSPGIPGKTMADMQQALPLPTRPTSPTLSIGSSSSTDTDDTHSTRTIVPNTPRPKPGLHGSSPLSASPRGSFSPTRIGRSMENGVLSGKRPSSPASTIRPYPSALRLPSGRIASTDSVSAAPRRAVSTHHSSSVFAFIKTTIRPYLTSLSTSQIIFGILFMLVPLFSLIIRRRRRRTMSALPGSPTTASHSVDDVRRRLVARRAEARSGMLGTVWRETVRAVFDAVRMAGSGLV